MIDPHLMKVCVCVCVCVCLCVFCCWCVTACNCFNSLLPKCASVHVCAHVSMCTHVFACVHMCGHVQLQAVYSADIIGVSTQRWVVLISFPSMPFEQHGNHGGEWIWNKFPMHWCGDFSSTHTKTHTYLAYTVQCAHSNFLASLFYSHGCGVI